MIKRNGFYSKLVCIIILCFYVVTQFIDAPWNRNGGVVKSDVKGYYAYLPALFINNDLKFENVNVYKHKDDFKVWYNESSEGVRYIKYSIGTSVLYAPFFAVAHTYAGFTDYKQDGFSKPYLFALSMSALFYLIIALFFMRKTLRLYFSETTVALTLLIIFLGTNVWNYYTFDACFSHSYSLAVIVLFIYGAIQWINTARYKYALWVGVSFGIMILIRPIDFIFILFLLLLFVRTLKDLKERFLFFKKNWKQVLLMIVVVMVCLFPQFLYFKFISGHWIFYTYSDEAFFFSRPNWFRAMFSFRNGWLIYSPLMFLSLGGILILKRKLAAFFFPIFIVFLVYTFVISSWWCWWYVGFGNRAFINLYPFLSFSLAALIAFVLEKKWWWKIMFNVVVLTGISLSIFQTMQYNNGAIHWGYMTKKAYYASFLRWRPRPLFDTYLEIPNDTKGGNAIFKRITDTVYISHIDFEKNEVLDSFYIDFIQNKPVFQGSKALFLPNWFEYVTLEKIKVKNANRIYISAWVKNPEEFNLCLSSEKQGFNALSGAIVDHKDGWDKIELYSQIPDDLQNQTLHFFIWKVNRNNACIDDVRIVLTNEKFIE